MRSLVIDTETASLSQGIVDIAIAEIDDDFNVLWSIESLIDPECEISPGAMGVHHITPDMVYDKPTIAEFMDMHKYPLFGADVLGGHKVSFDLKFLSDFLPDQFKTIDTLKLSRNTWPTLESHKLQTLRYTFGLNAGNAHRAMGDVITTISLMREIAEKHETDLTGLTMLMNAPLSLDSRIGFGKHRGEKLRDLPISYVRWLLDKSDAADEDLREALLARI